MSDRLIGISVIVPSFNQGEFIEDTINSLLMQEYPRLEIIVMDGGSTDGTIDKLKSYGNRLKWISEKDEGQSDALVKGFGQASHGWLTWLNSDDVSCNRALWGVAELLQINPDADVVVGLGHYMDREGANPRPYPTISVGPGSDVRNEMFMKGYVAQPSVFFRRAFYESVGGVDRNLRYCMDYDLWVRFALQGGRFVFLDRDISGNRWYETTKTANQYFDLLAEVIHTQVKHFGKVSSYFVQAVSDHIYHKLHGVHFGDKNHLPYRIIYFKLMWILLNMHSPWYCIRGFFAEALSKSGPIVNDRVTWSDYYKGALKYLKKEG